MAAVDVAATGQRPAAGVGGSPWPRVGAATGLLSIVLITIGYVLHGPYPLGQGASALAAWAAGTTAPRFALGVTIELLGSLLYLVFAAYLWSVVRRSDEAASDWLAMAAMLAASCFIGISALGDGVWLALLAGAREGAPAETLPLLRAAAEQIFNVSFLFGALFSLLIGALVLLARRLPRWLGAAAVLLGLAELLPPSALPASLLFELWVVVVSGYLLARPPANGAAAEAVAG